MSNSADGAREVYPLVADEVSLYAAVDPKLDSAISLPDGAGTHDNGLTLIADLDDTNLVDPDGETAAAVADCSVDIDEVLPDVGTGSDVDLEQQLTIPKQPVGGAELDTEETPKPDTTAARLGNAVVTKEVTDDAAYDLDPDEDQDFDTPTLNGKPVPTDLVDAYRQSMTGRILEHEEVIEHAKIVEAGKTAEWMLRIYDAADSEDEEALTKLRDSYIENRQANIILSKKDTNNEDGEEPAETDELPSDAGKPLSKAKQAALEAARNREIKHAMAVEEADELIAFALQHRLEAESGMLSTDEPGDFRQDLETVADQGVRARHAMIDSISRWAFKQSMKYVNKAARAGLRPIDVIQEGNIGAIRAVDKFDWKLGYRLSTYSDLWIKQTIDKAIAAGFEIRKPQHIAEKLSRLYRKEQELRAHLQPDEELTEEMIADSMDITPEELAEYRKWDQSTVSLDKRLGDGDEENATFGENYQDDDADSLEDQIAERDRQLRLEEALDAAFSSVVKHPKQEFVLRARFGLDDPDGNIRTRASIAEELGCSAQYVKILEETGLKKIREHQDIMEVLGSLR